MNRFIAVGILLIGLGVSIARAHGDADDVSASVGKGMAVTKAEPAQGFQLSDAAIKRLGIETRPIVGVQVPKESVVHFREESGVYRLRDGWFKRVSIKELRAGDLIAVKGVPLLRVTELDLFGSHDAKAEEYIHD